MYKHYISLGYNCQIAMALSRNGYRETSSPFDWLVTPNFVKSVLPHIENDFTDHLTRDNLIVSEAVKTSFYDRKYNIAYGHDIKHDFENEYESVKKKVPQKMEQNEINDEGKNLFFSWHC